MSARQIHDYERVARAACLVPLCLPRPRPTPLCEAPRPLPLLPDELLA